MRRHRRGYTPAVGKFHEAQAGIDALELKMVNTITVDWTLDDLVTMLWPDHIVKTLTEAFPMIAGRDHSNWHLSFMCDDKDAVKRAFGEVAALVIKLPGHGMCCPRDGLVAVNTQHPAYSQVYATFNAIRRMVAKFDKLRQIIKFFNDHDISPGAGRYFFPGVLSLLPATHAAHETRGVRFREPDANMATIVPLIREAAGTVAEALLCFAPPADKRNTVSIAVPAYRKGGVSTVFWVAMIGSVEISKLIEASRRRRGVVVRTQQWTGGEMILYRRWWEAWNHTMLNAWGDAAHAELLTIAIRPGNARAPSSGVTGTETKTP